MTYINLAYLRKIADGDESFLQQTQNCFISQIHEFISQTEENLSGRNWNGLYRNIHTLKPSIEIMGISSLKEPIRKLEEMILNSPESEKLPELLTELKIICLESVLELSNEKKSIKSPNTE